MEINDKFESISMDKSQEDKETTSNLTSNNNKKPTLVNLSNDSTSNSSTASLTSSQTNLDNLLESNINTTTNTSTYRQPGSYTYENTRMYHPHIYRRSNTSNVYTGASPRRMSNLQMYGNKPLFTSTLVYDDSNQHEASLEDNQGYKGCCLECGSYAYLMKFNEVQLCSSCYEKQWQNELNELLKMKSYLENGVQELKKYLAAKRTQCNENIKSSQQIKKFINMTMQQIKRKIELELENKRDELYHSIDAFVENQKSSTSLF